MRRSVECPVCAGTGTVRFRYARLGEIIHDRTARCHQCLGLGRYGEGKPRPAESNHLFVLHSSADPYEAIELLPMKETDDDRDA